uniref:Uncharacterized protein n=1 Tax=Anopheles albimanus TaxID=7167 RepID=A0A182FUV9_ANOAL
MRYLGFKILHFKWKNQARSPEATDWKNGSTNDLSAPLASDRSASVSQRVLGSFLRSMLRGPEPGSAPPAALTTPRSTDHGACAHEFVCTPGPSPGRSPGPDVRRLVLARLPEMTHHGAVTA